MSNEINPIHTPCKNCVFAEYEKATQKGCSLGLIEKYMQLEYIDVIEAYDEDKEFYIVNKKKCAGYREQNYFESRDMENATIQDKIYYIQDKLKINYICIINAINISIEDLQKTLQSISEASVHPKVINLVISGISKYTFNQYYKSLENSGIKSKWKITHNYDIEKPYTLAMHNIISTTSKENNFVLSIDEEHENMAKIINTANDRVYKEFKTFVVLSSKSQKTLLFNKLVYKNGLYHGVDILNDHPDCEKI